MKYLGLVFLLIGCLLSATASAAGAGNGVSELRTHLARLLPGTQITRVATTPIKGLYEVVIGTRLVYMNAKATYFLDGDLVEMSTHKNLSEIARSAIRREKIDNYPESKMLVYTPPGKIRHTITVVTDVDCPYCRRLHSEMSQYMADGIKVRYLFMPLKGPQDYKTTVSVWCSKDQHKALNLVKAGGQIPQLNCKNPIMQQYELARSLGVEGTPAIILDDGELLPGYVPESQLAKSLNAKS